MADAPKRGFLSKLFGVKKSCCCNLMIEEVAEEPSKVPDGIEQASAAEATGEQPKASANKRHNRRSSSCCG